eukprot:jgi/Psemu1/179511/e_gw1.9.179.1
MPSPLLYLPFKVPVRYDLTQPLANWLDDCESQVAFHSPSGGSNSSSLEADAPPPMVLPKPPYDSARCRSELLRIAALRNCISECLKDSHRSALEEHEMLRDCQDYHATLLEFEKRGFPTGNTDEENGILLTWRGAFSSENNGDGTNNEHQTQTQTAGCTGIPETHHTLLWDRACTLWNIAALRAASAALEHDETTRDGLKASISQLQQAASHLSLCRQLLDHSREHEYVSTVDLSKPMLRFWETLLLAQAQSCVYKLANLGGGGVRNHSTLAYLIQGAAPLYNEALTLAKDPRLQSELPNRCREWAAHCKARSLVCQARAYFHVSIDLRRSQTQHGTEIGRLKQAVATLQSVLDFCNGSGDGTAVGPVAEAAASIQPEAEGLLRLAGDRLRAAEEDNRTVYLEEVPRPGDLPEIRAQTMVKRDLPLPDAMLTPRANLFGWE